MAQAMLGSNPDLHCCIKPPRRLFNMRRAESLYLRRSRKPRWRPGCPSPLMQQYVGAYYGAAISEAATLVGREALVVGGGNSAGQAAVYLARFAARHPQRRRALHPDRCRAIHPMAPRGDWARQVGVRPDWSLTGRSITAPLRVDRPRRVRHRRRAPRLAQTRRCRSRRRCRVRPPRPPVPGRPIDPDAARPHGTNVGDLARQTVMTTFPRA